MAYLHANDTISGLEGKAFVTIGGEVEEMFYIKKIEAKVEKQKTEIKALGRRGTQHKAIGWNGSGSMTIYYITSKFRQLMKNYIDTGSDAYFNVMITNQDPASSTGLQTVTLKRVNLNSVVMALLDTGSETLEEEVDFTFEDVTVDTPFANPAQAQE
jgi:hypothetical protein